MRLPVHLDVPDAAVPPAQYAVVALLDGLGLTPAWTDGAATLYVGVAPEASDATVRLRVRPEALQAIVRADAAGLGWLVHDDARWPLPVGPAGAHAPAPGAVVEASVVESAFWWLAGVQEAATRSRDLHGRFAYADSLQAQLPLAQQPAVDGYRAWLASALRAAGAEVPGRRWGAAPWAVALTHDVDAMGRARSALGALARGRPDVALLRAWARDPRRASVEALASLARRHGATATFFWKGGASSREDVAYRLDAALLRPLAADGFEAGLHPSYHAHAHAARLAAERDAVARAAGGAPVAVRSHFLRWHEPGTAAASLAAGLRVDSTLGFAEAPGFRRGTATPFRLWDAAAGRPRDLWEVPLAVMDTSLFTHLGLSDAAAAERLDAVLSAARAVGGVAVVLWHPALDADPAWARRLDILDRATGRARAQQAAVGGLAGLWRAWRGLA